MSATARAAAAATSWLVEEGRAAARSSGGRGRGLPLPPRWPRSIKCAVGTRDFPPRLFVVRRSVAGARCWWPASAS